jgi:hypothetical protein
MVDRSCCTSPNSTPRFAARAAFVVADSRDHLAKIQPRFMRGFWFHPLHGPLLSPGPSLHERFVARLLFLNCLLHFPLFGSFPYVVHSHQTARSHNLLRQWLESRFGPPSLQLQSFELLPHNHHLVPSHLSRAHPISVPNPGRRVESLHDGAQTLSYASWSYDALGAPIVTHLRNSIHPTPNTADTLYITARHFTPLETGTDLAT